MVVGQDKNFCIVICDFLKSCGEKYREAQLLEISAPLL